MRALMFAALVSGLALGPAASARADVHITIMDGYVSLEAKDATVRQILAEWARVGQTRIVNAERVTGTPLTLQLVRVPEAQALDIVLRNVSGYMAAPRQSPNPTVSQFDRILVMPTSVAPRAGAATPAQPPQQQAFQPPAIVDDVDMDEPQQVPPGGTRGPIFPQYPNPANANVNGPGPGPGNFPQRGPMFPTQANPIPIPNANPNSNPTMQFPPVVPQNMPFPGAVATPGAPTGAVGVSTPGMMVAPPQPPIVGNAPPEPQD